MFDRNLVLLNAWIGCISVCGELWGSVSPKVNVGLPKATHISLHHQTLIFINFIFVNTGIRVHNGRPICWWIRILNFEETQRESHEIMAVIRTLCEFLKRPLVYILVVCLLLRCGLCGDQNDIRVLQCVTLLLSVMISYELFAFLVH